MQVSYADAIRLAFEDILTKDPHAFAIGQGLWAPWYVGTSMKDLDKKFGKERIIDSPVSEAGVTGAALGAALNGSRPIVIHPRIDFMLLAVDQIVTQAANWSSMFAGAKAPITIRGIINRGGQQGAQHSQALHSWFAHIPGLRVVMPATAQDAYDLLYAAAFCDNPVLYIDDRWLYEVREENFKPNRLELSNESPRCLLEGSDITLVGASYCTELCLQAAKEVKGLGISAEVIDLRVINPLNPQTIIESVSKTKRLLVLDGGFAPCGLAAEIITSVLESTPPSCLISSPQRICLPSAPAPSSSVLEENYFPTLSSVVTAIASQFDQQERANA